MTQQDMVPGLPRLHSVEEVARALACTENYVRQGVRRRGWPHVRMARGAPFFTAQDVEAILDLQRGDGPALQPTVGLVPRSASYHRRRGMR